MKKLTIYEWNAPNVYVYNSPHCRFTALKSYNILYSYNNYVTIHFIWFGSALDFYEWIDWMFSDLAREYYEIKNVIHRLQE